MAFFNVAMKKVREESRCSESDAFHADTLDGLVLHHAVPP
jgi:hypothetical protein